MCSRKIDILKSQLKDVREVTKRELDEVKELEKKKDQQERDVLELQRNVEDLARELKADEQDLLNGIDDMVTSINSRFSQLMNRMNFAGEVELHRGDEALDFKNYGLKILVKFRSKDSLQPLTASVQSGGEKSVTTALYIMA